MTNLFDDLEVGFNIPAKIGMDEADVQTPCLILDLDALERNIKKMGRLTKKMGVNHRAHGKMHKSVDVALLQENLGGSCGTCCQKVSEAESFARGGIKNILISNQISDPAKINRLARIPNFGTRVICCVDDLSNVDALSAAAIKQNNQIECLVEVDCGGNRCGVKTATEVVALAKKIDAAPGLKFTGVQAYQGEVQHLRDYNDRKSKIEAVVTQVNEVVATLKAEMLNCEIISGGGTGSFYFEGSSGVFNELQCGSYAFMDADYGRVLDENGKRFDQSEWENALFILTSIMSHVKADKAICDAGLKSHTMDSGLPVVFGDTDFVYTNPSDEHGEISDPKGKLKLNDKLKLIPGHCDPTCNLHDWYVGVRNGKVESLWPITARGLSF